MLTKGGVLLRIMNPVLIKLPGYTLTVKVHFKDVLGFLLETADLLVIEWLRWGGDSGIASCLSLY